MHTACAEVAVKRSVTRPSCWCEVKLFFLCR